MPGIADFDNDLKKALKESDSLRVSVLRLVKSALKYKEIDKTKPLTEEEIASVLSTLAKQRRESIEMYEKAGRTDLADKEKAELLIVNSYLPEQISSDEIRKLAESAIKESGATGPKEMGKVMAVLMPKVKGKADGKEVQRIVKELLGG